MRRKQDVFQRLGALLLALVMVVGMCPMQAAAKEDEAQVMPFSFQIRRTPIKKVETTLEAEITGYDYTVEFVGAPTPEDGSAEYWWYIDGVTLEAKEGESYYDKRDDNVYVKASRTMRTNDEKPHTVKVCVKVDGMTLLGAMPDSIGAAYSDTFTWGVKGTGDVSAYVGVPFKLPAAEPDGNSGLNGSTYIITENTISDNMTMNRTESYQLVPTKLGETGTVTREYFVNDTLRARETVPVAVAWPNYNAVFTIGGKDYRSGDTACLLASPAFLTITIPAECGVVDAKYLPQDYIWTKASDGSFTATVENPGSTITLGNESVTVIVDSTVPTINNAYAYYENENDVKVVFDYTVGSSGVKSLKIGEVEQSLPTGGHVDTTVPATSDTLTIQLTSRADTTCRQAVAVTPVLKVTRQAVLTPDSSYENSVDPCDATTIQLTVSGVRGTGTVSFNGTDYTVQDNTVKLPFKDANGQKVTLTDSSGRTAEYTISSYIVDEDTPVVDWGIPVTYKEDGSYTYINHEIVITPTASDVSGLEKAKATLSFDNRNQAVELDLTQPDHSCALRNGDLLEKVSVEATDNLSHKTEMTKLTNIIVDTEAPVLTMKANNIAGFRKNTDGSWYAVLQKPDAKVTVTATLTDKNFSRTGAPNGWQVVNDNWYFPYLVNYPHSYTKTFETTIDQNANSGKLEIFVDAVKDLAGNPAAGEAKVIAADGSCMTVSVGKKVTLNVSQNPDENAPTVTFQTNDAAKCTLENGNPLYADNVTFEVTVTNNGSGIQKVTASVSDSRLNLVEGTTEGDKHFYKITADKVETDNAELTVTVLDTAGVPYVFTQSFAIDGKAPDVIFDLPDDRFAEDATTVYYKYEQENNIDARTIEVKINDLFPDSPKTKINDNVTGSITVSKDSPLEKLEATVTDKAGHETTESFGKAIKVVDAIEPEFSMVCTMGEKVLDTSYSNRYVPGELDYTVKLVYPYVRNLRLLVQINWESNYYYDKDSFTQSGNEYTYTFHLTEGQKLTGWHLSVNDYSIYINDDYLKDHNLPGVVLSAEPDITLPKVTLTRSGAPVATKMYYWVDPIGGEHPDVFEYYDQPVTYDFTFEEKHIGNSNGSCYFIFGYQGPGDKNYLGDACSSPVGGYTSEDSDTDGAVPLWQELRSTGVRYFSFPMTDGARLYYNEFSMIDEAGNPSNQLDGYERINGADIDVEFDYWSDTRAIIVDCTPPKAALNLSSNTAGAKIVDAYQKDGKTYLKLSGGTTASIGGTLTIVDANLCRVSNEDLVGWDQGKRSEKLWPNNNDNRTVLFANLESIAPGQTKTLVLKFKAKDMVDHLLIPGNIRGGVCLDDSNSAEEYDSSMEYIKPAYTVAEDGSIEITLVVENPSLPSSAKPKRNSAPAPVDSQPPKVSVSYDNNNAANEMFFKAPRTITIVTEDENLRQVSASGSLTEKWTEKEHKLTFDPGQGNDAEYTLSLRAEDLFGNVTEDVDVDYTGTAVWNFIIDRKAPVVTVTRSTDAADASDGKRDYYNKPLTYSFQIQDKYLDPDSLSIGYTLNGKQTEATVKGGELTLDGDKVTYAFTVEAGQILSGITIRAKDKAGNDFVLDEATNVSFKSADGIGIYDGEPVEVDTAAPTIEITGGSMSAEQMNVVTGDLQLQLQIQDEQQNLVDYEVSVSFQGANLQWVTLPADDLWYVSYAQSDRMACIDFNSIEKLKANDGIYVVNVTATDRAGNVTELAPALTFSMNRFGSTFLSNDTFTTDFLSPNVDGTACHSTVDGKLTFQEISPSRVFEDAARQKEGSALSLLVNGESRKLVRGTDYTVEEMVQNAGDSVWYTYTYAIDPAAFREGENTILICGEDEAGTAEMSRTDSGEAYTGKFDFVLDTTAPVVSTTGIESGKLYKAEAQQMQIDVSDSTPVAVKVYLNDGELPVSDTPGAADAAWVTLDETTGTYTVNVPKNNAVFGGKQTLRVVALDSVDNEITYTVQNFRVTTSLLAQMIGGILP